MPKNKKGESYRIVDNGYTRVHKYASGRTVDVGPGSIIRSMGSDYSPWYKTANALTQASVDTPLKTLQTTKAREQAAQGDAYNKVAGYYAGLGANAKDIMGQVGQVGKQTNEQLSQIGNERNAQVQGNTTQYSGPLGSIAQNLANQETQAALNTGAQSDAANKSYGASVSGSRQALAGNIGVAQQQAGQGSLAYLRGLGQQALDPYNTKIADLQGGRGGKLIDTIIQLQQSGANQNVAQAKAKADQRRADAALYKAQHPVQPATKAPQAPKPDHTPSETNAFWKDVSKAKGALGKSGATYNGVVSQYGETIAAAARSLYLKGYLTPYAVSLLHKDKWKVGTRYRTGK